MAARQFELLPKERKERSPRRVLAHMIDAGDSGIKDYPYGAVFECKKCGWVSKWLGFKNPMECKRGTPCEVCN